MPLVMGDGAYDNFNAYQQAIDDGFKLVVPPKDNAIIHNSTKSNIIERNKQVEYYQKNGIHACANKNSYWDRNRVETTMSRFVTSFGDRLSSRTVQAQKNEIVIKCKLLNIMILANKFTQDNAA